DRGRLAPGLAADVTVFDPATVGCSPLRRVRDFPAGADRLVSDAPRLRAVVVNGVVIREDGRDAGDPGGPAPGRVARRGRGSPPRAAWARGAAGGARDAAAAPVRWCGKARPFVG